MDLEKLDLVKTGDVIISSFDNLVGYGIRVVTNSEYHHIAIAIRIDKKYLPKIKIVKTGGTLCLLENKVKAVTFNNKTYHLFLRVLPQYKHYKFLYRPLKADLYSKTFKQRMRDYVNNNVVEFFDENNKINYITEIIGSSKTVVPHSERYHLPVGQNVCSELTFSFYKYCLSELIKDERFVYIPKHFLEPHFNNIFEPEILLGDKSNGVMNTLNHPFFTFLIIVLIVLIIIFLIYRYFL